MAGPDLIDLNVIPIGYADVMVDIASDHISDTAPALTHNTHSLGGMNKTEIVSEIPTFEVKAGNPQTIQEIIPTGETFMLNVGFMEKSTRNMAIGRGLDPTNWDGGDNGSGEIPLGNIQAPVGLRVEATFLYPDLTKMVVIMPRAQVIPNITLGSAADSPNAVDLTFQSLIASDAAPGGVGDAAWNFKPLGAIRQKLDS